MCSLAWWQNVFKLSYSGTVISFRREIITKHRMLLMYLPLPSWQYHFGLTFINTADPILYFFSSSFRKGILKQTSVFSLCWKQSNKRIRVSVSLCGKQSHLGPFEQQSLSSLKDNIDHERSRWTTALGRLLHVSKAKQQIFTCTSHKTTHRSTTTNRLFPKLYYVHPWSRFRTSKWSFIKFRQQIWSTVGVLPENLPDISQVHVCFLHAGPIYYGWTLRKNCKQDAHVIITDQRVCFPLVYRY